MEFTLAGPLATSIGALLGWYFGSRGYALGKSNAVSQWRREIRAWADQAIVVLAKAGHSTTKSGPNVKTEIDNHRVDLSALIDRGRLLFPNEQEEKIDTHKPIAYRGLRHKSLDPLVAAYRVLGDDLAIGDLPDKRTALVVIRREFVSIIQPIVGPRDVNREIARFLKKDATLGGLLPSRDSEPTGAEILLNEIILRYQSEQKYED
jgi:hypothetical protein